MIGVYPYKWGADPPIASALARSAGNRLDQTGGLPYAQVKTVPRAPWQKVSRREAASCAKSAASW